MKKTLLKITLAIICASMLAGKEASAFQLTPSNWSYKKNPMGENWTICSEGMPEDAVKRTREGAAAWNYEHFKFTFGPNGCLSGGEETIVNEIHQINFGELEPGVLGRTHIWSFTGSGETVECDMRFNDNFSATLEWYTGVDTPSTSQVDWQTTAAHEMGHCLGLNHSELGPGKPVMATSTKPGEIRRTLTEDDINGRNEIYSSSGDEEEFACPLSIAALDVTDSENALETLRNFRDTIMVSTQKGKQYIKFFYKHAIETSLILLRNPDLRAQIAAQLEQLLPVIESSVNGVPAMLTAENVNEIETLLAGIQSKAGHRLKETLRKVKADIKDGAFLPSLGFNVDSDN